MLTYQQTIREIEKNGGLGRDRIWNDADLKADFTADINLALSETLSIIFATGGTWQFDDTNHTDYPIITTNIVSGQRDYSFTSDETGNLILDIYKIVLTDAQGNKREIPVVDQQTYSNNNTNVESFNDTTTGTPNKADLTANGIFFDVIPDYSRDDALEVYINRDHTYFNTSDTTKKAGFNPLFHEYLALVPSYKYARNNSLANTDRLRFDMEDMRTRMKDSYGKRNRAVNRKLQANVENTR
jgi:hypothetical protein